MQIFNLLLPLIIIALVICFIELLRNERVYKHRLKINNKIYETRMKELHEWGNLVNLGEMLLTSRPKYSLDWSIMDSVTYDHVLHRFWRLDLDSFYSEEYRVGNKE